MSVSSTDRFELSTVIEGVPPERVYDAWIDADEHTQMTGGGALSEPRALGRFSAWDGYIEGTHLELERPSRIVQSWRTAEFPADAPDSRLELRFEPEEGGTRITLAHSLIPDGQGPRYQQGWEDHYFAPMRAHFSDER